MKNLNYLNEYRVKFKDGNSGDEFNGMFQLRINGSPATIIASNGLGWEHVSISHTNRIPSWETMCKVKELFFEDNEVVMQLHPRKEDYVNNHPYCLHLWKPIDQDIPTPPIKLV
jgi:hypothetical protein